MSTRNRLWPTLSGLILLVSLCPLAWGADCIGMVPSGSTAFWRQVEAGAGQAALDLGVALYYRGPSREGDVAAQLQVIERVLAQGCKTLVIAPGGVEIGQRIDELAAAGIPTLYIDRDLNGTAALGLVSTDNFSAGLQAGEYMAELLGGQGRVAVLRLRRGLHSTSERERGFIQGAEAGGLQVTIDAYVGDDRQLAMLTLSNRLDSFDGLFTPNSTSSRAALAAMRTLHKAGQRVHIGFDGDEVLLEALRLGDINALFVQQPRAIGYEVVKQAHQVRQAIDAGLTPEQVRVAMNVRLITRANMAELYEQLRDMPSRP
nr:substrate-binding domain-containing protein [uncultured Pseudomonas sp.]